MRTLDLPQVVAIPDSHFDLLTRPVHPDDRMAGPFDASPDRTSDPAR
jgi:hypothetical protein